MARPQKNNADYFGHPGDFRNDRRCKALRAKFGHQGYGAFLMILEVLTASDYFHIKKTPFELELLSGDFDIESNLFAEIVEYLLSLGLLEINKSNFLCSPLLRNSLQHLQKYRKRERIRNQKRKIDKIPTKEVYPMVNPPEEAVYHVVNTPDKGVYPMVNTTKESKGKRSKEKESKEKGSKVKGGNKKEKNAPREINFLKSIDSEKKTEEESEEPAKEGERKEPAKKGKEKSCAKKENTETTDDPIVNSDKTQMKKQTEDLHEACKLEFLKKSPGYFWEKKDDQHLQQLIKKVQSGLDQDCAPKTLRENFTLLLDNLPGYWRTKKFTLYHINENYNEIINEIKSKTDENRERENGPNGKYGRHRADELAERAKTFGRKNIGN
jgi:hypothetical protein